MKNHGRFTAACDESTMYFMPGAEMGTGSAFRKTSNIFASSSMVADIGWPLLVSSDAGIKTPHSQLRQVIFVFPVARSLTIRPLCKFVSILARRRMYRMRNSRKSASASASTSVSLTMRSPTCSHCPRRPILEDEQLDLTRSPAPRLLFGRATVSCAATHLCVRFARREGLTAGR